MFTIFHTFNNSILTDAEKSMLLKYVDLYSDTNDRSIS